MLRGTTHEAEARAADRLHAWAQRFQEELPLNQFVYPVRTDAPLPEGSPKFARPAAVRSRCRPRRSPPTGTTWINQWTDIVLR